MPLMRADSSPSSSLSLGLGKDPAGGHAVFAGVRGGGQAAPMPSEAALAGGDDAPTRPLQAECLLPTPGGGGGAVAMWGAEPPASPLMASQVARGAV